MPKGTCSIEDCERMPRGRGFCLMHYKRARREGRLQLLDRSGRCSVDGCSAKHHGHGFCSKHYQRWQAHGDPLGVAPPRLPRPQRVCAVSGCTSPHYMREWCGAHYRRWRKWGDPLRTAPPRIINICSVEGCDRRCSWRGMCSMHVQRVTREENRAEIRAYNLRWQKAHPEQARNNAAKRRAKVSGVPSEDVRSEIVMGRDRWICQLCGDPISPESPSLDPLSPSVDHIIPITRGGSHTYDNVQAAHLRCNMRKGARTS